MDTVIIKEPASHMAPAAIEYVPLTAIKPSPTNPRKKFDKAALEDLAGNLRVQGILNPLLLRPIPASEKGAAGVKYQIVAGERRWRAARIADLAHAPAIVRSLSDVEVLEIQITENLQRQDLGPLEEADGYARLIQLHKDKGDAFAAEQIAEKIGKSRSYVFNCLKLNELGPEGRKALDEDKLNRSRALLIARIPAHALQKEAVKAITEDRYEGAMSYRDARDHIQEHFMLALGDAPFDIKDEQLVPAAGSCVKCPKRTGNQPDLFGDVKSRDICTDPPCFTTKRQALAERRLAELKAKGKAVITGDKAAEIVRVSGYDEDRVTVGGGYLALDDRCRDDPKGRTVREVVGKQADLVEVVLEPKSKQLVEVVRTDKLKDLLNQKGVKTEGQKRAKQAQQTRKDNEVAELEEEINRRTVAAIYKKHAGKPDRQDLLLVAAHVIERFESSYGIEEAEGRVGAALGLAEGQNYDLEKRIKTMDAAGLLRFLLVMGLAFIESTPELRAVAKRHKVDVVKIRRDVLAPVKAPDAKTKKK